MNRHLLGLIAVVALMTSSCASSSPSSPDPSPSTRAASQTAQPPALPTVMPEPPSTVPTNAARVPKNGWIAFTTSALGPETQSDIYLVRDGQPAHRIVGSDSDGLDERCPAFSPDGRHLAYGRAQGNDAAGHLNAALVVADLDAQGTALSKRVVAQLGGKRAPPCPVWSPDGELLAYALVDEPEPPGGGREAVTNEVQVARGDGTGPPVSLSIAATDLEWAPDGSRLAVANLKGIVAFATNAWQPELLRGTQGANSLSWSPDGRRIAFQRADDRQDLLLLDLGSGATQILARGFEVGYGNGPIWSPTGDRLLYLRVCDTKPEGGPCRETHDVVVLAANEGRWGDANVTATVMPKSYREGVTDISLEPYRVTWSPDAEQLLYVTWDHALIDVPLAPGSTPTMLAQQGDLAGWDNGAYVPIQIWGSEPTRG